MTKYSKFIVAIVGAVVTGITLYYGETPEWLTAIIPFLSAIGVYSVSNK